jgi:cytochrome P450
MTMPGVAAYDPLDVATQSDPYPLYHALREAAPLGCHERLDLWTLSRHEDVAPALHDHATFASDAAALSPFDRFLGIREAGYVAGDSRRHDALREVLRPLLGATAVERLQPEVEAIADRLLDDLAGGGVADLAAGYARRLPVLVTCALLGLPEADAPAIGGWVDALFGRRPGLAEVPPEAVAGLRALWAYLEDHAGAPGGMATLAQAADAGAVTREESRDIALILVAAGIKTTSGLIGTMLMRLAADPEQQRLVWREPALGRGVVEEALRHDGPAQWVARVTTRPVVTAHGTIRAHARVLLLIGSANRDERRYADPDAFDVRRPAVRNLAFGSGLHFCAGAALARLEARVALQALIARTEAIEPAGPVERILTPAERELARLPCALALR